MSAKTMAKITALKNPETWNPDIMLLTNRTIKTLIIKDISPRVRMFKGKVKILKINPIVALAKPISNPAIIAEKNPST